ncbi:hypothetical protein OsI_04065 [Oryza sativa Indica Group]|uniref:Uncharacterized protein n=1 Tax=Oryza sativa subsp. indica TaxID=39946 RepID=A2WVZ1_ORYSI|nr:hypothetical protein OsI_04065 [Oryza sativa Indica Group]
MMRRSMFLPVCALVLVMLCVCVASHMDVDERRGGARAYMGGHGRPVGIRPRTSGSPRGLSGGTWAACAGSSLLTAAAMLM